MSLPIKLLSTDFDGTLHAEFEDPPVPIALQELIAQLQSQGVTWVINTGRDLSSLMETLGRARLSVWPDYVVAVEREIYRRDLSEYVGLYEWNRQCALAHDALFHRLRLDVPMLSQWVKQRFQATIYEDAYSPFCLIAQNNGDADVIHRYLAEYCVNVPNLTVVRNDVYARFSHIDFNKGFALGEIARQLGVPPDETLAAGDHLNDLPMLSKQYARWLVAPSNAVESVKTAVRRQHGYISDEPHGHGLAKGLRHVLDSCWPRQLP